MNASQPNLNVRRLARVAPPPRTTDPCPECHQPRARWRENLGRGCLGEDGETYCSQFCAGRLDAPDR
jgi:hypothetical protein